MSENHNQSENRALVKRESTVIESQSSSRDPNYITQQLKEAMAQGHLVSPATSCPTMREGCAIMVSKVLVDVEGYYKSKDDRFLTIPAVENKDVYFIAGAQYGLSKSVLQKIQTAAGISWDPDASYRVDDAQTQYYCEYCAVGTYFQFDGTPQTITGRKEIDLRDGSALCVEIYQRAEQSATREVKKKRYTDADLERAIAESRERAAKEIRQARIHIVSLAETKAQLRAIRSLGIKSSYTLQELKKPFLIAKLAFTGETDDPELRKLFAEKTADYMMGGRAALFGGRRADVRRQLAPVTPAPPLSVTHDDFIPGEFLEGDEDVPQTDTVSTPLAQQHPTAEPQPEEPTRAFTGLKVPFGEFEGKHIDDPEVSMSCLSSLVDWYSNAIENPDRARFKVQNQKELVQILREVDRRRGVEPATSPPQTSPASEPTKQRGMF